MSFQQKMNSDRKKNIGKGVVVIVVAAIAVPIIVILLGWIVAFFPLDFSQDYKAISGIENVVFQRNGSSNFYKRCFWGLERTDAPATPISSKDDETVWEIEAFADLAEKTSIRQAILSPDGSYILYCELEYNYKNTGLTDDEYCHYKVFNVDTGEIVQIYGGYKEWYNLDWL